jgi:hypothetical protein
VRVCFSMKGASILVAEVADLGRPGDRRAQDRRGQRPRLQERV